MHKGPYRGNALRAFGFHEFPRCRKQFSHQYAARRNCLRWSQGEKANQARFPSPKKGASSRRVAVVMRYRAGFHASCHAKQHLAYRNYSTFRRVSKPEASSKTVSR